MYKKKIFSIITVVLNNKEKIERCIKSVLSQNFKNFEYIIVDGGSTDGTQKIIENYRKKVTKIIVKKDKNMWEAMNRGIKSSKGEIICILNSDDYFTKNALNIANNQFQKNNIDYFFGAVKKRKIFYHFNPEFIKYKFNCYPSHSVSFFVKRSVHKEIGLYDTKFNYCSDYDFFFKLFKNKKFKYVKAKKSQLIGYFDTSGSSSRIGFFKTLYLESKIRLKNKQNLILVLSIMILRFFNKLRNKIFYFV